MAADDKRKASTTFPVCNLLTNWSIMPAYAPMLEGTIMLQIRQAYTQFADV